MILDKEKGMVKRTYISAMRSLGLVVGEVDIRSGGGRAVSEKTARICSRATGRHFCEDLTYLILGILVKV